MAEDSGDKEDKFDAFTAAGESLGYISRDQAQVLAMSTARETPGAYGASFVDVPMAFEVVNAEDTEDHYVITLSFRPQGQFSGNPGQEQFFIEKEGTVAHRQVLSVPSRRRRLPLLPTAIGLVIVAAIAVGGAFAGGAFDGGEKPDPNPVPVAAPTSTPVPVPTAGLAPTSTGSLVIRASATPRATRNANTIAAPTAITANTGTVSLVQLRQSLRTQLLQTAPSADPAIVDEVIAGVMREAESTGKASFTQVEIRSFLSLAVGKIQSGSTAPMPIVAANRDAENFGFQLACASSIVQRCDQLEDFVGKVSDRTEGRVAVKITSLQELGFSGSDIMAAIAKGSPELIEVPGSFFINTGSPIVSLLSMPGLFADADANIWVLRSVREELGCLITEQTGGVVIAESYNPESFIYSMNRLERPEDLQGLIISSNDQSFGNFINAVGAEYQQISSRQVRGALELGVLDAAMSVGLGGNRLSWHEVSKFLIGPISPIGVTWLIMNREKWNDLPSGLQNVIREEAIRHQEESLRYAINIWTPQGIQVSLSQGMEHVPLTPELREAFRKAAITTLLPAWVKRVGGVSTAAVKYYNSLVAPIVGIEINPDGTILDTREN